MGKDRKIVQKTKVNVNCCDNKKESVRPSAFKAVNATSEQIVTPDNPVDRVLYPVEIFDLNNEYDPNTSTFIPKQDGVYLIIASFGFFPDVVTNYRVRITIFVNGDPVVTDNDFFGEILFGNVVSVSAILPLKAKDTVNVEAASSTSGVIAPDPIATHFEASRLHSPDHFFVSSTSNTSVSNSRTSPDSKFNF